MLALLLPQRIPIAPEVPTLAEAGVSSVSWSAWQAIFAPPNTPSEIADGLSREVAAVLRFPSLRTQLEQQACRAILARVGHKRRRVRTTTHFRTFSQELP